MFADSVLDEPHRELIRNASCRASAYGRMDRSTKRLSRFVGSGATLIEQNRHLVQALFRVRRRDPARGVRRVLRYFEPTVRWIAAARSSG
jgi:ribosomal protein L19